MVSILPTAFTNDNKLSVLFTDTSLSFKFLAKLFLQFWISFLISSNVLSSVTGTPITLAIKVFPLLAY